MLSAFTKRVPERGRNGETRKSLPLRICPAVRASTISEGISGSISAAGTSASAMRPSSESCASCSQGAGGFNFKIAGSDAAEVL